MAKKTATVRVYNIRFGDCFLVSIPAAGGEKHILIDFGNASGAVKGGGGANDVFRPIVEDILQRTNGRVDLVILTHEHLDHLEGFYSERRRFDRIQVGDVWFPIMSEPHYYEDNPQCEPLKKARLGLLGYMQRWGEMGRLDAVPEDIRLMMQNNVLDLSNQDRVKYLRGLPGSSSHVHYIHRGVGTRRIHGLGDAVKIEVLAPEKDASVYYPQRDSAFWKKAVCRLGTADVKSLDIPSYKAPAAPSHMAQDEFEHLREDISEIDMNDMLAIDKAANNTSLVLRIRIGRKTMLFTGDAEAESWAIMKEKGLLEPVDLLKVAHHGSLNGMPFEGEESVVPLLLKTRKKTKAIVSTRKGVYGKTAETGIPNPRLMKLLKKKCKQVLITENNIGLGEYEDVTI
ncbi:MAG: MBL fold metallo-hydrolase [Anaerolineales bacterium]